MYPQLLLNSLPLLEDLHSVARLAAADADTSLVAVAAIDIVGIVGVVVVALLHDYQHMHCKVRY